MAAPTRGSSVAQPVLQVRRQHRHREALALGHPGGDHAHAAGVAQHADPEPAGQRLLGQHGRGLGDVGAAAARDHAGLREQGGDADAAADRPPGDHGEQRLALGEPARGPRELQRVAERLEVQRRDRHRLVLAPRGQQVVAGHVELGPERRERVHADPLRRAPGRGR